MATLSESNDSWAAGGIMRRDFQHDHSGPEELPHKRRKGKAKPRPNKKPGCPGNEGKAHIYVWVKLTWEKQRWSYETDNTKYRRECLGCKRIGDSKWRFIPAESDIYETRHYKDYWDIYPWW